jgi:hypothetical protein
MSQWPPLIVRFRTRKARPRTAAVALVHTQLHTRTTRAAALRRSTALPNMAQGETRPHPHRIFRRIRTKKSRETAVHFIRKSMHPVPSRGPRRQPAPSSEARAHELRASQEASGSRPVTRVERRRSSRRRRSIHPSPRRHEAHANLNPPRSPRGRPGAAGPATQVQVSSEPPVTASREAGTARHGGIRMTRRPKRIDPPRRLGGARGRGPAIGDPRIRVTSRAQRRQ